MAMVFSPDVLFIHVPKTGGVSVTQHLLNVLPDPLTHVGPNPLKHVGRGTSVHIPGKAHQTLEEARDFLASFGRDIESFPLILAIVRNPYDLAVSMYAYKQKLIVHYELVDHSEDNGIIPPRPSSAEPRRRLDLEAVVTALTPKSVARVTPDAGETVGLIELDLYRAAAQLGKPIETWQAKGELYVAPYVANPRKAHIVRAAIKLEFRDFVIESIRDRRGNHVRRLYDFYHLDGMVPSNLRIARFERLADDIEAALAGVGLRSDEAIPWLNRSERGPWTDYYDAETEAIIYEQARWLFDEGFYERLTIGKDP